MVMIYIDKNMTSRAHPDGWPEEPKFVPGTYYYFANKMAEYQKVLAQAKSDSVPFDTLDEPKIYDLAQGQIKPDSFLELPIEVEFVRQMYSELFKSWSACTGNELEGHEYRTIARLKSKPVEKFYSQEDAYSQIQKLQNLIFNAGKKEGCNEAIEEAAKIANKYIRYVDGWPEFKSELDKLKK